jgi:single-strand DNA-binding protein
MATKEEWTDASGTKQEKTEWHDVAVFTKAAPACAKYLSKGSLVYVEGKLQSREWEKDGVKRRAWTVNAMNVVFLSFKEKPQQASAYDDPFVGEPAGAPADDADIPF